LLVVVVVVVVVRVRVGVFEVGEREELEGEQRVARDVGQARLEKRHDAAAGLKFERRRIIQKTTKRKSRETA
jgi:hypothetical protein